MGLRDDVLAAAEEALAQTTEGLTLELLARQIAVRIGRQMPATQIATALRTVPERLTEGSDGRWRTRQRTGVLEPDDLEEGLPEPQQEHQSAVASAASLRPGCYVVFDLEATGQDAQVPETEIIQIAAWRWVDGQPQEPWSTFVRPRSGAIPPHIAELTHITTDDVRNAPDVASALRAFFTYCGTLPLVAHNGASYDGPLIEATCTRLHLAVPHTLAPGAGPSRWDASRSVRL